MTAWPVDPVLSAVLAIAAKATAILAAAALADLMLRRNGSASARHMVWTLAVVGVVLLPGLSMALPSWSVTMRAATAAPRAATRVFSAADRTDESAVAPAAGALASADAATMTTPAVTESASPAPVVFAVYVAGVAVMLAQILLQRYRIRRLLSAVDPVRDRAWIHLSRECASNMGVTRPVRLLRSRAASMPMAVGTLRPAILLPSIADTWEEDRRRAVLLHELAHVARLDCLTQTLACVARAAYWVNPAMWWAVRRLRTERELACDDRVLAAGAVPGAYADHLLEIAYAFGSDRAPALAVTMARPRQLEGRLLAVLDDGRNRRVPAVRTRIAAAAIAAAVLVPLTALTMGAPAEMPDSAGEEPFSRAADFLPAQLRALPPQQRALPPQQRALPPELRSIAEPLRAAARRVVRAATAAFGLQGTGTWEIRPTKTTDGTVQLRLVEGDSSWGRTVRLDQLEGLTAAQLAAGGPVQFKLRRDAGTFTFDGVVRGGVGAGTFTFAPDPAFGDGLAKRGFARPTAAEQYELARGDVGYAFVDELTKQGYGKPATADLIRAAQHGVSIDYLREMGALGYRLGTLQPLVELRDHGVTPEYIRALAGAGYKGLRADELRTSRDHGVSADYVAAMREAGYSSLTMQQLVNARDHGVSANYVRGLAEAGHRQLPFEKLIAARDHGVSDDYAREMRALGYQSAIDDLIRARDHGVSDDFVRELAAQGYKGQPIEALIRLRDHGVSPKYIQELKALGYTTLSVDDLVALRDHGLSADRIRAANARAGTRLSVDMLTRFRD